MLKNALQIHLVKKNIKIDSIEDVLDSSIRDNDFKFP